jgi:Sulfotransferase domain
MIKWLRKIRQWQHFARLGIPVFLNKDDEPCFRRESGVNADPVIIVSVPKSGTYLFGELLSAVGVQSLDIHIAAYGFQDLRYVSKEFAIAHSEKTFEMVPFDKVLPLVRPGQFLVSHFPFTEETARLLKRFKIIFTYRDLRDTLVSTMRWVARKGQLAGSPEGWEQLSDGPEKMERFVEKHGEHYLGNIKAMRNWAVQPGVLNLSFEEIQGDFGAPRQVQAVQRSLDLLGISLTESDITQALQKCLGKETLTFSGKRSSRKDLWSDKVEEFCKKNGADELDAFWAKHR